MFWTGKKVYDPMTNAWSSGYWIVGTNGIAYPIWSEARKNLRHKEK